MCAPFARRNLSRFSGWIPNRSRTGAIGLLDDVFDFRRSDSRRGAVIVEATISRSFHRSARPRTASPRTATELPQQPHDGVEVVGHPLLHRDDAVVGDVDVLGAHLGAALGDVAEADAGLGPRELPAVDGVERVHVEAGDLDEEAWPREGRLQLIVVTDDVTDVLAEEALDALVELLDAIDVLLNHPVGAVGPGRLDPQRRHLPGLLVVVGHV